ncbi:MAG: hypothetical protein FWG66_01720 [Spirochaetes bacterium]|nr:hypothetical protein [Spirochaetota bacterium]
MANRKAWFKANQKKITVLAVSLLLIFAVAVPAFARSSSTGWEMGGQIVNADTFAVIQEFNMLTSVSNFSAARNDVRRQLGFPQNFDTRNAGGVEQRIIWGNYSTR